MFEIPGYPTMEPFWTGFCRNNEPIRALITVNFRPTFAVHAAIG
ncbi:conserved hypothetical protein [Culex quinquefasciatus]|uniref:Uncharacterized protein n=1 Tax=Culex quinquefasciatus TaxID=7176 RepID=B0WY56_CULQU|nr:conserved hypothetical protein [Culex quinquefasciatus]|eukprot:XP_001862328.1 conserved hypothetical protein [Culex quinquefasciatus]